MSAPYDVQKQDRIQVRLGLELLNKLAQETYNNDLFRLGAAQERRIVELLIQEELGRKFFLRFRYLLVGGYFTSDYGMRILGYRGNIPLRKAPELTQEVRRLIEEALQKLGL